MRIYMLLLLVSTLAFAQFAKAQEPVDSLKKVVVVTYDGKERIGEILSDDGREILLLTASLGKIYISKENIKEIRAVAIDEIEQYNGDFRSTGPFTTRYSFTTNALPIKKNEDYALLNIYGPEVHFSIADNLSIGVMATWIASPLVLALKYTIPTNNEKINIGLGTLGGTSGYLNSFRGYGALHWGMITFGSRMKNITVSGGFSYLQSGITNSYAKPGIYLAEVDQWGNMRYPNIPYSEIQNGLIKAPIGSIAGIAKVGKKASFIFDSMLFFTEQERQDRKRSENLNQNGDIASVVITENNGVENLLVLYVMPGMRFQNKDDRAFQISLAGVTVFNRTDNEAFSFPAPMFSWFSKF